MRHIDISGQVFGKLTVIQIAQGRKGKAFWHCQCACGLTVERAGRDLRNGSAISCGCARVHGYAQRGQKTPEYIVWAGMKARCLDPHHIQFKNYGGRGISVCDRWRYSFENFLADMGPRPSGVSAGGRSLHSIERKESAGNYEPGNCKWATVEEQSTNKRKARITRRDSLGRIAPALQ